MLRFEISPQVFNSNIEDSPNSDEGCTNVSDHFSKITEDLRNCPKKFGEDPKAFRLQTNNPELFLMRAKVNSNEKILISHSSQ